MAGIPPIPVVDEANLTEDGEPAVRSYRHIDSEDEDPNYDAGEHWRKLMKKGRIHHVEYKERPNKSTRPYRKSPPPVKEGPDPILIRYEFNVPTKLMLKNLTILPANITRRDLALPPRIKERRILLRKCESLDNNFSFFESQYLSDLLSQPNHKLLREGTAKVTWSFGPDNFYITYEEDWDQITLISNHLTYMESMRKLTRYRTEPKIGDKVVALSWLDGNFHRGQVISKMDQKTNVIRVNLVDQGIVAECPIHQVRVLPAPLTIIEPLALRCHVIPPLHPKDPSIMGKLMKAYFRKITNVYVEEFEGAATDNRVLTEYLTCKIMKYDPVQRSMFVTATVQYKYDRLCVNTTMSMLRRVQDDVVKDFKPDRSNPLLRNPYTIDLGWAFFMTGARKFRVSHIESAQYFFVEDVTYPKWSARAPWKKAFKRSGRRNLARVIGDPIIDRYYIWLNRTTGLAERVKMLSWNTSTKSGDIYLIDAGKFDVAFQSENTLYELERKYCVRPVTGFRAYLADITLHDPNLDEEILKFMRKTVLHNVFNGIITDKKRFFKDQDELLGLILCDKRGHGTLNAELCLEKLAIPTGVGGISPKLVENFVADISLDQFRKQLLRAHPGLTIKPHTTSIIKRNLRRIPSVVRQHLPACSIIFMHSPSFTTIQMEYNKGQLEAFMDYLGQAVTELNPVPLEEPGYMPGQFVAVCLIVEEGKQVWHRAIIRSVIPAIQLTKAILTDFGTEVSVKFNLIRPLPDVFQEVPGFCFRTHLDVPGLAPVGTLYGWPTPAVESLRRYVTVWETEKPGYFAVRTGSSSIIELNDFNQALDYNHETKKWVAAEERAGLGDEVVNDKKDHVMLRNLYRSVGVDIWYEQTDKDRGYRYGQIWDVLVGQNLATHNP